MAHEYNRFPLELIPEIVAHPEDYRVLSRVPYTEYADGSHFPLVFRETPEPAQSFVFLEMTTAGTRRHDSILELVLIKCSFLPDSGEIVSIDRMVHSYEAPRYQIPSYISKATGITNESISGQSFDYREIESLMRDDPIIVSTRGVRAREFFERRFSSLRGFRWVNSVYDVRWEKIDARLSAGSPLQISCERLGFFYRNNRIVETALVNLWLFSYLKGAVSELTKASSRVEYLVWAYTARFEVKEELKFSGYQWNRERKCWYKHVYTDEEVRAETDYLREKCSTPDAVKVEVLDSRKGDSQK